MVSYRLNTAKVPLHFDPFTAEDLYPAGPAEPGLAFLGWVVPGWSSPLSSTKWPAAWPTGRLPVVLNGPVVKKLHFITTA